MPSILIVDDEPIICQFLSLKYKKEGFDTLTAKNGKEALSICKQSLPDVILTDMRMPVSTGYQLLEELKNLEDYKPVIVCMSAYSDLSAEEANDLGGTALFNKPFAIDDIVGATKKFLEEKGIKSANPYSQAEYVHEQQVSLLSEISPGIIHNINNHIAFISGSTYLLKKYLEDELANQPKNVALQNALKYSEKIVSHSEMITKIIKSIKMLAYPNTKRISKEKYNLFELLENTKYLLEDNLKINDIKVQINCDKNIIIQCLPELLIQVFINLIKNSCESIAEQNLEERWIIIDCWTENKAVQISVTDSGKRLPIEIQEQLMKPFYTTKNREKGIGLGLSISKKLLEIQYGSILYDSFSENAKFIVILPLIE